MAIVPTMEEEDAKRPHREREGLVHEQTRVVNRMKSALIQFGVRNFNPKLRKARVKLETVRTPEGKSLPPNTIAALRRDMERLKIIKEQIKAIEQARLQQFEQKRGSCEQDGLSAGADLRAWFGDGRSFGARAFVPNVTRSQSCSPLCRIDRLTG